MGTVSSSIVVPGQGRIRPGELRYKQSRTRVC